jgi:hypothetical protein
MAKVTIIIAVLLIALGVGSYIGTGSQHPTALIPTWFGLALGIGGFLAMSPDANRRKLYMHINVTIGLLGFLGAAGRALTSYGHARSEGIDPDKIALGAQGAMAGLLLIYVLMCVRSFIEARRARVV